MTMWFNANLLAGLLWQYIIWHIIKPTGFKPWSDLRHSEYATKYFKNINSQMSEPAKQDQLCFQWYFTSHYNIEQNRVAQYKACDGVKDVDHWQT